eukprot:scaffold2062_cov166-Amphora_coffeaeformis.AAC.1
MRDREILQISLGSPACAVTAHLLNLQGLAATTTGGEGNSDAAYCQAGVTHAVTQQQWRVPRALLIDAAPRVHRRLVEPPALSTNTTTTAGTWSGAVEALPIDVLNPSRLTLPPPSVDPWLQSFQDTSQQLAGSQFSRYRFEAQSRQRQPVYEVSSSNSRHVDWDDLRDEEEEEEEETEQERRARLRRQRYQWQRSTLEPLQNQLNNLWESILEGVPAETPDTHGRGTSKFTLKPDDLLWTDFLAPPLHPRSILSLPAYPEENAYFPVSSGTALSAWAEDEVFERMRNMLEDCDACQGCVLSTSGFGIFAGLGTQVLHYLQDECPSTSRVVLSYDDSKKEATPQQGQAGTEAGADETNWRDHYVEATRHNVSKAMAWYDFGEAADAILQLQLPTGDAYPSRFHASASVAAALEATTLPFRVRPNKERLRIGMNSYYYGSFSGDSDFGTVPGLSLSEFLGIIKPRDKLLVLELDTLTRGPIQEPLWPTLLEGTSVERDNRMRESPHVIGNRRPREVLPGRWLLDPREGGRLTSLSRRDATSRALHKHFALATAVRPSTIGSAPLPHYVDCLMQGMGVRFRPEQSAATVLDESLTSVTDGGYGAGSYWKSIWKNQPVLAVVGNTTRFYPKAHSMAVNLKSALSSRSRGFYNRDVSSGLLPEMEDCQEALTNMWDLRDLYQPPDGSGLVENEEGEDIGWKRSTSGGLKLSGSVDSTKKCTINNVRGKWTVSNGAAGMNGFQMTIELIQLHSLKYFDETLYLNSDGNKSASMSTRNNAVTLPLTFAPSVYFLQTRPDTCRFKMTLLRRGAEGRATHHFCFSLLVPT